MKRLGKHWPTLLGLALLLGAAVLLLLGYLPARAALAREEAALRQRLDMAEREAALRLAALEDGEQAEPASGPDAPLERLTAWCQRLPATLREEEQIAFVLELEALLDTEIAFRFGTYRPLAALHDGAELGALRLDLQLETDAAGLAALLRHLEEGERPVTVHSLALRTERGSYVGDLALDCYLLRPAGETE